MEKYRQIYNDILERLRNGEFDHDNKLLPSDQQLVMKYKTSRETVRKAMKLLADEGYVQRLRGKGTIAIERRQFLFPVAEIKCYQ
jgi:GntR family trehalose operon transcriptional repressor